MRQINTLLIILFLPMSATLAQEITVRVDCPRVVMLGEQIRVAYTVNTSGGEFISPSFDGFYLLSGPNTSYSRSTQIVNGRTTSETAYSYVFYIQAIQEGKFTIPSGKYTKGGKTYSSEPLEIEVLKDAAARPANPAGQAQTGKEPSPGSEMFIRVLLSKREVYVGEPIVATVKLYTRTDITGINEIKYPSFSGFMKEDIETPQLTSLERENVDGTIYGTGVFQKFLLYPQRTGEITIEPAQITVLIRQQSGTSDPFFGDIFQTFSTVPRVITGQAQNVMVKPLPANRPDGFTGAVGSFEIKSVTDNDTVPVNEAVNLTVTISGKGNIRLADAPVVSFPAGLESYDPKTTTNAVSRESGTTGSRVFEYLIIPRSAGDFTLPAITWSYFDPEKGLYQVVRTMPLNLHVTKGAPGQGGPQLYAPASGEEIQYIGKDIRFIRTTVPVLRKSRDSLLSGRTYFSIYGFSLLIFISVVLLRREQVKRNSDRVRVMNRRAGKVAATRLKKAQKHMQRNENEIFYEEVLKALWGYLSDKLNIPVSQLTRERAKDELSSKGADNQVIDSLMLLADICELVRYAPSSGENEPQNIYDKAAGIIRKMEGQLN